MKIIDGSVLVNNLVNNRNKQDASREQRGTEENFGTDSGSR